MQVAVTYLGNEKAYVGTPFLTSTEVTFNNTLHPGIWHLYGWMYLNFRYSLPRNSVKVANTLDNHVRHVPSNKDESRFIGLY